MTLVNISEAKNNLSKYVAAVASKEEESIVILRNGKPAAKIVPFDDCKTQRIGIARGKLPLMGELSEFNSIKLFQ